MREGRSKKIGPTEREPTRARHWRETEPSAEKPETNDSENTRRRDRRGQSSPSARHERVEPPSKASSAEEPPRERVLKRAMRLLAARPRSERELRERLLEKERASAGVIEEAIEKLREYGYVSDEKFALGYASYRVQQKPIGKRRLLRELAAHKLSEEAMREAVEAIFTEHSEEELLDRAIEKRLARTGPPRSRADLKRLYDHLLRAGFPHEIVMSRLKDLKVNQPEEE